VAAYAIVHGLAGTPMAGLELALERSHIASVALETDEKADDVRLRLTSSVTVQMQAKLTLRAGPVLKAAVAQWNQAAMGTLDPDHDRLVIVAGTMSGPMRTLARVLNRLRTDEPGALTSSEQKELDRLSGLLPELTTAQRDRLFRCAVIMEIDVQEEHSAHSATARALLAQVVAPKDIAIAWRVLVRHAGRVARLRGGFAIEGWTRLLVEEGVTVRDAPTAAMHAMRLAGAIDRYREQLIRRGTHVDLRPLGSDVAPIPLADMDAEVDCGEPGGDSREDKPLAWSLLRHGRVLLTGLPGGGKSTSVAYAGAVLAQAAGAPLPVVVSLRDVANRNPVDGLADRILDTAVRDLPAADRPLVKGVLERGLQSGATALLLDSLDETHDRRQDVVREVGELTQHIDAGVPMLMSTRDVAYAPAHSLGWTDLRCRHPDKPEVSIRAVLAAVASARGQEDRSWLETRVEWVMRVLRADRAVGQTPLMPVLLALLAAERDRDALPSSRAEILHAVVQDVVARRERERALFAEMTGMPRAATTEAVQATFCIVAGAIADRHGAASVSEVRAAIADELANNWGLPPGLAGSGAGTVTHFWDEAGIFVIDGNGAQVIPRLELFLDIGDAVLSCRGSKLEVTSWVTNESNLVGTSQSSSPPASVRTLPMPSLRGPAPPWITR
jgi:hypothetical protein